MYKLLVITCTTSAIYKCHPRLVHLQKWRMNINSLSKGTTGLDKFSYVVSISYGLCLHLLDNVVCFPIHDIGVRRQLCSNETLEASSNHVLVRGGMFPLDFIC